MMGENPQHNRHIIEQADAIEAAVSKFLKAGYRTADLQASPEHKAVSTAEAGDLITEMI